MDHLAGLMGQEGQYAVFVGSLTSKSHNEWIDGAIARQREKYPRMELVTERIEEYDNRNLAYEKTKELLKAFPKLRGIQGSASTTAAGAGLAVEERGLQEKVMVVRTGLVSQCRQYLENGSTKLISLWDPADAGYVVNRLAVMLLSGGIDVSFAAIGIFSAYVTSRVLVAADFHGSAAAAFLLAGAAGTLLGAFLIVILNNSPNLLQFHEQVGPHINNFTKELTWGALLLLVMVANRIRDGKSP